MLKEYIKNTVQRLYAENVSKGRAPENVRFDEILAQATEDIKGCLNALCSEGELTYSGENINKVKMFKPK